MIVFFCRVTLLQSVLRQNRLSFVCRTRALEWVTYRHKFCRSNPTSILVFSGQTWWRNCHRVGAKKRRIHDERYDKFTIFYHVQQYLLRNTTFLSIRWFSSRSFPVYGHGAWNKFVDWKNFTIEHWYRCQLSSNVIVYDFERPLMLVSAIGNFSGRRLEITADFTHDTTSNHRKSCLICCISYCHIQKLPRKSRYVNKW